MSSKSPLIIGDASAGTEQGSHDREEAFGLSKASSRSDNNRTKRIRAAYLDILIAGGTITLPMIILSGLLLGLVFKYQVGRSTEISNRFNMPQVLDNNDDDAYLVDFSATKLITLASWTSSIAPLLPSFVMTLLSYPTASHIVRHSTVNNGSLLPTPYQLSLYLRRLGGTFESLWDWYRYCLWRRKGKQSHMMASSAIVLTIVFIFGGLILVTDTWLHVTTSTILLSQTQSSAAPSYSFGRGLRRLTPIDGEGDPDDPVGYMEILRAQSCLSFLDFPAISVADDRYLLVNNLSSTHQLSTFQLQNQTYAFLTNVSKPDNLDFHASTFAVATQCIPKTRECNLQVIPIPAENKTGTTDAEMPFSCSPEFSGDLTNTTFLNLTGVPSAAGIQFFKHPDFTGKYPQDPTDAGIDPQIGNPLYFGTWATVMYSLSDFSYSSEPDYLADDAEIVHYRTGFDSWILACTTSVYQANYTWINGSVTYAEVQMASDTLGDMIGLSWFDSCAQRDLEDIAKSAYNSSDFQDFANQWSLGFSKRSLAGVAMMTQSIPNIEEQSRSNVFVARIPKAPLFVLICLNLLYITVGFILTTYAMCSSITGQTKDGQMILSLTGLTAACFEEGSHRRADHKVETLFAEKREATSVSKRVGLVKNDDGGLRYGLFQGRSSTIEERASVSN